MKRVEVEFRKDNVLCVIKVYGDMGYVKPFTTITINTDNTFTVNTRDEILLSFLNYNGLCDVLAEAKKLSVVNNTMKFEEFRALLPTITEKFIESIAKMTETNYIKVIGGITPNSEIKLLDYISIDIGVKDSEKFCIITMVSFHDGCDSITVINIGVNGCRFGTLECINGGPTIIPLDLSVFKGIFDNPTEDYIKECCEKVAYRYDYNIKLS